jgi:hypothetical protein
MQQPYKKLKIMSFNINKLSVEDLKGLLSQINGSVEVAEKQEAEKSAASVKYEAEKLSWAENCVKLLANVTAESFEAVFTSLPSMPVKPAILAGFVPKNSNGKSTGNGTVTVEDTVYNRIDTAGKPITKEQICNGDLNVNTVGRILRPEELRAGYKAVKTEITEIINGIAKTKSVYVYSKA